MKYTLGPTIGTLRYNGKEFYAGDKVEMTKEDASKIQHHLLEEVEPGALKKAAEGKEKELDDPDKLK